MGVWEARLSWQDLTASQMQCKAEESPSEASGVRSLGWWQLRKEGFIWAHRLRVQPVVVVKAWGG